MRTVKEVSKLSGVSVRTLHYYDRIGLLKPAQYTPAGYRLYDDAALETLQQILLFRELEFPLTQIKRIIADGHFDRKQAVEQQITLLKMKKEHLETLIGFAEKLKTGGTKMTDFSAFDQTKMKDYAAQAKEKWGDTAAYREFSEKTKDRTKQEETAASEALMRLFAEFGEMRQCDPASDAVQKQVEKLQDTITANYYTCTDEILCGLAEMYAAGGDFTQNIDARGGNGTAVFTAEAIRIFCGKKN